MSVIDRLRDIENGYTDGYAEPFNVGLCLYELNRDHYDELSEDDALAWIVLHNQWARMDSDEQEHLLALAALVRL